MGQLWDHGLFCSHVHNKDELCVKEICIKSLVFNIWNGCEYDQDRLVNVRCRMEMLRILTLLPQSVTTG